MKLKNKTFTGTTSNEVTARETENRKLARLAAAEGFVLLKNQDHILPLKKRDKTWPVWCRCGENHQGGNWLR